MVKVKDGYLTMMLFDHDVLLNETGSHRPQILTANRWLPVNLVKEKSSPNEIIHRLPPLVARSLFVK